MRTAKIANGKFLEAIGWAKETSSYVEKKWGTPPVNVWIDSFGEVGTIRWSMDFTDLSGVEKVQGQMLADQGYWQLVEKAMKAELFVDGSTIDSVFRKV
jgi:hypothetical protein